MTIRPIYYYCIELVSGAAFLVFHLQGTSNPLNSTIHPGCRAWSARDISESLDDDNVPYM